MKKLKIAGIVVLGELLAIQQAFAGTLDDPIGPGTGDCPPDCTAVPEIDGAGAIVALGLVAGLVAFVRERYFRK